MPYPNSYYNQINTSYLFSSITLVYYYFQWPPPSPLIIGSNTILKLLSIIWPITRAVKLPVNYKHGFVFIYINHILPFLSIKKS